MSILGFELAGQGINLASGGGGGGGGFMSGFGGPMGLLGIANSIIGGIGQRNTAQSAQNQLAASAEMFDANFGRDLFTSNLDYARQMEAPRWQAKFAVNDPSYRQYRTMQNLPLAGRYGAFTLG